MIHEEINRDLIDVIGIDRIRFITDIESISTSTFMENKGYITYSCDTKKKYTILNTDNNEELSFDSLRYKVEIDTYTKTKDKTIYEVKTITHNGLNRIAVDIVLGRYLYGTKHNAYVVKQSEVKQIMNELCESLLEIGLALKEPNTWTISYIELNKTIESDKSLMYYDRALTWLLECVYDSIDDNIHISTDRAKFKKAQSLTYTIHWDYKNDNRTDIIYSKSEQIRQQLDIIMDGNLIRFESKYCDKQIIDTFGTYNAYKILGGKSIDKLFNGSVQKIADIVNESIESDIEYYYDLLENNKYDTLLKYYSNNCADLFDVAICIVAINKYYKANNKTSYSRDIQNFIKDVDNKHKHNYYDLCELLKAFNPKVKLYKFKKYAMKYSSRELD